ncbi:MAG TPA: hypothetical protein VFL94_08160 [Actinomycetales bacterium]|nr:hypothetical protein [Actinomycetales bacterium]
MDLERVAALRDALSRTEWWERSVRLGRAVRRTPGPGHLLLVGTPTVEPWHLAAHLDDESRLRGVGQIAPQLVRWQPPPGAPAHLAIGLQRLERVERGETVFVVAPDAAPDPLLERVDDARRTGATVLSLDCGDRNLTGLAHEQLSIDVPGGLKLPGEVAGRGGFGPGVPDAVVAGLHLPASFEVAQHFVSAAAGESDHAGRPGWRDRLAALLDRVSGPVYH